jgi:hypothetical protein
MNRLIIFFLLCSVSLKAQQVEENIPKAMVYYWFYIKFDKTLDKTTGTGQISIKNVGNDIESGTFNEFLAAHAQGLKSEKVAIGPFSEQYEAQNSQSSYRSSGRNTSTKGSNLEEDDPSFTFFYVKPFFEDSTRAIKFERIPSRVSNGTLDDFNAMLNEGLGFEELAIGPFYSYETAERAKFTFRKNGIETESKSDSLKMKSLELMSKRWKSLKLVIAKQADDKILKKSKYRFSTNFPGKYFAQDAIQVIKITANYTDTFDSSNTSFTLQGDGVDDNNFVISSTTNTVYVNFLYFDKVMDAKIKGFFFESFIFNDNDIIELDPILIKVK